MNPFTVQIPESVATDLDFVEGVKLQEFTPLNTEAEAMRLRALCFNYGKLELAENPSSELATDYFEVVSAIDRASLPQPLECA